MMVKSLTACTGEASYIQNIVNFFYIFEDIVSYDSRMAH